MLLFRKGRWHEINMEWDEPLFEPLMHLANGYYLDGLLSGLSGEEAQSQAEKRLYKELLEGAGQRPEMASGTDFGIKPRGSDTCSGVARKKHNSPKNKEKYT